MDCDEPPAPSPVAGLEAGVPFGAEALQTYWISQERSALASELCRALSPGLVPVEVKV
jgi:hypothetical protein